MLTKDSIKDIIFENRIPSEWQESHIVSIYKGKGEAFDRVPREVIWWSMRKLKIDEWLVRIVQSMYKEVRSRVRVGDEYSNLFDVRVDVHQGSVLSPLFFVVVLEALFMELRTGCPWEILYADDLMVSAQSIDELLVKLRTWRKRV